MEGGGGAVDKKCCTKSRAVALGCKVDGNYIGNQLIPKGSASKAFVSPEVQIHIITNRSLSYIYFIKIYDGSEIYLSTSNTKYIHGDWSRMLLGSHYIDDPNVIGKSLSVSIEMKATSSASSVRGSYEWELNGSIVPTNTIVLHEGDVFDIIFTDGTL